MSHHEDKKNKKKALLKKNRRLQEIFQVMRLQRTEDDRMREQDEDRRRSGSQPDKDGEAMDKVANIRNRLTNQRRVSKERWNRFSGTGGEGGRGL